MLMWQIPASGVVDYCQCLPKSSAHPDPYRDSNSDNRDNDAWMACSVIDQAMCLCLSIPMKKT